MANENILGQFTCEKKEAQLTLMLKLTAPSSLLNVKSAIYFLTVYIVCLITNNK